MTYLIIASGRAQRGDAHPASAQPKKRLPALPNSAVLILCPRDAHPGEVAEWSNAPDSKSGVPQGTGGSNPSLSATL
jgi:hypothetical protein